MPRSWANSNRYDAEAFGLQTVGIYNLVGASLSDYLLQDEAVALLHRDVQCAQPIGIVVVDEHSHAGRGSNDGHDSPVGNAGRHRLLVARFVEAERHLLVEFADDIPAVIAAEDKQIDHAFTFLPSGSQRQAGGVDHDLDVDLQCSIGGANGQGRCLNMDVVELKAESGSVPQPLTRDDVPDVGRRRYRACCVATPVEDGDILAIHGHGDIAIGAVQDRVGGHVAEQVAAPRGLFNARERLVRRAKTRRLATGVRGQIL